MRRGRQKPAKMPARKRRLAAVAAIAASWALEHHKFAAKVRDMMPEILKKVAEEENAKQARRMEHRGVNGWIMSLDAWYCMVHVVQANI